MAVGQEGKVSMSYTHTCTEAHTNTHSSPVLALNSNADKLVLLLADSSIFSTGLSKG